MQKTDTTIYEYEMSNLGASYENPRKETFENYKERKGFSTDQEAIDHLNAWGGKYFIGTQTEYDLLNTVTETYYPAASGYGVYDFKGINHLKDGKVVFDDTPYLTKARWDETHIENHFYFELNGKAYFATWKWWDYLKGNQNGVAPKFTDLVTDATAKELTKVEYDALVIKNAADNAFALKVSELISISSPKLAAYIAKCEDYIAEHVDDLKAPQLKTFILKNGKIDEKALETAIKANQDKSDSIALLCEAYLSWIVLIEKGTQAGLDELPETDPTKLNAIIDALWKAEHDKERKALIAKLNSSEAEFAIVDKYLVVTQGDEPEVTK